MRLILSPGVSWSPRYDSNCSCSHSAALSSQGGSLVGVGSLLQSPWFSVCFLLSITTVRCSCRSKSLPLGLALPKRSLLFCSCFGVVPAKVRTLDPDISSFDCHQRPQAGEGSTLPAIGAQVGCKHCQPPVRNLEHWEARLGWSLCLAALGTCAVWAGAPAPHYSAPRLGQH